jgi:hypothetical protein
MATKKERKYYIPRQVVSTQDKLVKSATSWPRPWLWLAGSLLILGLLVIGATQSSLFQAEESSLSGPLVQLAWFYRPPDVHDMPILSEAFKTFILTKNDEPIRDELKAEGIKQPILQYITLDSIIAPPSCSEQPWRNQVADQVGDYCDISEDHPDWFLLDEAGERIMHEVGYGMQAIAMDPGHPGWRAFWLERARESQEKLGWEGVFLDNVEASLSKHERRGSKLAAYPTDISYQTAVEGFLAYLYTEYFQPEGRPLYANIIEANDPDVWFRYIRDLDGAMDESWALDWNDEYLEREEWEDHLLRVEETQAQGKHLILVAQGTEYDFKRQTFAYASYLLVSAGKASFRYTNSEYYHEVWLYPNYELDLGQPLGPRYQDGYAWQRDFTNGRVRVDLSTNSASITMSEK